MKFAKTFKKAFAATIAAASAVCTFTSFSAYAAEAAPHVYVDLNYVDEDTARADVIFENFDELALFGVQLKFGSGWTVVKENGQMVIDKGTTLLYESDAFVCETLDDLITAGFSDTENLSFNGVVFSFYVNKTSSHNASNSWIVYNDVTSNCYGYIDDNNRTQTYSSGYVDEEYKMLEAYEYLVGDVNGDGAINPVDATAILVNYNQNGALNVHNIRTNYKQFFANATCAATPDATQDGIINTADADEINSVYSLISMGATDYDSMAGKYDYFEIYND